MRVSRRRILSENMGTVELGLDGGSRQDPLLSALGSIAITGPNRQQPRACARLCLNRRPFKYLHSIRLIHALSRRFLRQNKWHVEFYHS